MSIVRFITSSQRYAFFKACSAACQNLGLRSQNEREKYRKTVMKEETGKEHLSLLNRTTDFDACMARFARDAGDWQMAAKFASGDEYRMAVMIRICCLQLMQLKGIPEGTDAAKNYLRGILEQSRVSCSIGSSDSSYWMDISKDNLMVVFQILDTARRRLLAGFSSLDGFRAFDPSVVYSIQPNGHLRLTFDAGHYSSFDSFKINIRSVS